MTTADHKLSHGLKGIRMRFTPPAYFPTGPDHPLYQMPFRMMRSQIEGWPRAIFEDPTWQAPIPGGALFVMEPEAIKTVLQTNAKNFPQGELFRRIMKPAWGKGLFVADEAAWRMQRHAVSGAFRPAEMASLTPFFTKAAETLLASWHVRAGERIDIDQEMIKLTFDVILKTLLSGASDFNDREFLDQIDWLSKALGKLKLSYLLSPDSYHKDRPSAAPQARRFLINAIRTMIARRRKTGPQGDLVDLLFQGSTPDDDKGLSDELVADNILGFIMAGHETTAVSLTWVLYIIAAHPPTRTRLLAEIKAVAGEDPIRAKHIPQLIFTKQVICETMRLYPQAFSLTRVAQEATTLAGQKVAAGQRVNIPIYAIHRRAEMFLDPHAFDPDRFSPEKTPPDRFAYLPFGAGPRVCLGAAFAMTEMISVVATLIRGATFIPPDISTVWPLAKLSMRPKGGMPMQIKVC
jgi:cytochrome P450